MRRILAMLLLMFLLSLFAQGQSSNPQPPSSSSPSDSSSTQAQPSSSPGQSSTSPNSQDSSSKQTQPSSPAAPPDNATPDQGTQPAPSGQKDSVLKRKLKELAPGCVNVGGYHKCRSSSPDSSAKTTKDSPDKEYADDMDVGDFYFKRKNYAGAMMRFKDALEQRPNDPQATFRLAQSLEALQKSDEARDEYAAYLKLEPKGRFAGQAKKAMDRLQAANAGK